MNKKEVFKTRIVMGQGPMTEGSAKSRNMGSWTRPAAIPMVLLKTGKHALTRNQA